MPLGNSKNKKVLFLFHRKIQEKVSNEFIINYLNLNSSVQYSNVNEYNNANGGRGKGERVILMLPT